MSVCPFSRMSPPPRNCIKGFDEICFMCTLEVCRTISCRRICNVIALQPEVLAGNKTFNMHQLHSVKGFMQIAPAHFHSPLFIAGMPVNFLRNMGDNFGSHLRGCKHHSFLCCLNRLSSGCIVPLIRNLVFRCGEWLA